MYARLLHIFRNTPFGRETLLHSGYFCKTLDISLNVYIPRTKKFLMYFDQEAVEVDLDSSYLSDPDTAVDHLKEITGRFGITPLMVTPQGYTASTLPDIPTDFEFMCCPRVISDLSSRVGLGQIGSKVRSIVKNARFPVHLPGQVFKPWTSVAVLFGGSANAVKALHLGIQIGKRSNLSVDVFTQAEIGGKQHYESLVEERSLTREMQQDVRTWRIFEQGDLGANLFEIPHDALVVLGAYGHGLIKDIMFGSTMEKVQSTIPNNLLIVGPNYVEHPWYDL